MPIGLASVAEVSDGSAQGRPVLRPPSVPLQPARVPDAPTSDSWRRQGERSRASRAIACRRDSSVRLFGNLFLSNLRADHLSPCPNPGATNGVAAAQGRATHAASAARNRVCVALLAGSSVSRWCGKRSDQKQAGKPSGVSGGAHREPLPDRLPRRGTSVWSSVDLGFPSSNATPVARAGVASSRLPRARGPWPEWPCRRVQRLSGLW